MNNSLLSGQNGKSVRNSSIELLRIIAMVFIVFSHCAVHGGFLFDAANYNNIFIAWLTLGNLGVDIFVIITGYFSCQRNVNKNYFIRLISQVYFYSILCFIIAIVFSQNFSIKDVITVFLPTIFGEYWFFTAFFVLMLLSPYINIIIEKADRKQLLRCIVLMVIIWSVIPTFTTKNMYGTELPQFIMFYLIGAYFRKYPNNIFKNKFFRMGLPVVSFMLLLATSIIFFFLGKMVSFFAYKESFFYDRTSLLVVGCAVGLFALAAYRKVFTNKFINIIGGCTFGIYLMHDNPFIRKLLWLEWIPNFKLYNSVYLPVMMVLSSIFVFVICILIDYLRKILFADLIFKIFDWLYVKIRNIVFAILNKVSYMYNKIIKE